MAVSTPEELAAMTRADADKWGRIIRQLGLAPRNNLAEREGIRTPDTVARVPHPRRLKPLSHLSLSRAIRQRLVMHEAELAAWVSLVVLRPSDSAGRAGWAFSP